MTVSGCPGVWAAAYIICGLHTYGHDRTTQCKLNLYKGLPSLPPDYPLCSCAGVHILVRTTDGSLVGQQDKKEGTHY